MKNTVLRLDDGAEQELERLVSLMRDIYPFRISENSAILFAISEAVKNLEKLKERSESV